MPLITLDTLIDRFGADEIAQLTATAPGEAIPLAGVDAAIAEIDDLVAAALSARYAWPPATVPPLIEGAACDLVRARLCRAGAPEGVEKRAQDARRLLENLAAGKLTLGAPAAPAAGAAGVAFTAPASTMSGSPYV